jgi:hypothetical protein
MDPKDIFGKMFGGGEHSTSDRVKADQDRGILRLCRYPRGSELTKDRRNRIGQR